MEEMNTLKVAVARLQILLGGGATSVGEARREADRISLTASQLIARESSSRPAVTERCVEWASTGHLGSMTPDDALFLYERVKHGCALGLLLLEGQFECKLMVEEVLKWLLIESWENISYVRWKWETEKRLRSKK